MHTMHTYMRARITYSYTACTRPTSEVVCCLCDCVCALFFDVFFCMRATVCQNMLKKHKKSKSAKKQKAVSVRFWMVQFGSCGSVRFCGLHANTSGCPPTFYMCALTMNVISIMRRITAVRISSMIVNASGCPSTCGCCECPRDFFAFLRLFSQEYTKYERKRVFC